MNPLGITVVLVLLVGVWAQINVLRPECDSPEAEEAALVAQDYLNAQHSHGYKYVLNRIDDIKVYTKVSQQVSSLCSYRLFFCCFSTLRQEHGMQYITQYSLFISSWPLDNKKCKRLNCDINV